jgi:hypothetical protein
MTDEFYATIKLKTGEEIFSKVSALEEEHNNKLLLHFPIVVEEIIIRGRPAGYKMEPWLKTTSDDLFVIDLDNVMTMSESSDIEMVLYYDEYIKKSNRDNYSKLDSKMGYLGNIKDAKKALEKLYKL